MRSLPGIDRAMRQTAARTNRFQRGYINLGAYGNTCRLDEPDEFVLVTNPMVVRCGSRADFPCVGAGHCAIQQCPRRLIRQRCSRTALLRTGDWASGRRRRDDATANNHDGTYGGGVGLEQTGIFLDNDAARFDGADDVVIVADHADLRPRNSASKPGVS